MACPFGLTDTQKADEEDRKTDHAPLVAATENDVATLTATIERNLGQGDIGVEVGGMKGDLTETQTESTEASSEWEEDRQKSRADEIRREVIFTVDEEVFVSVPQHGRMST